MRTMASDVPKELHGVSNKVMDGETEFHEHVRSQEIFEACATWFHYERVQGAVPLGEFNKTLQAEFGIDVHTNTLKAFLRNYIAPAMFATSGLVIDALADLDADMNSYRVLVELREDLRDDFENSDKVGERTALSREIRQIEDKLIDLQERLGLMPEKIQKNLNVNANVDVEATGHGLDEDELRKAPWQVEAEDPDVIDVDP